MAIEWLVHWAMHPPGPRGHNPTYSGCGKDGALVSDAQLVANDAQYYYLTRSARDTDWSMWWVFDHSDGPPPAATEIVRHVLDRAGQLAPLRRRIYEVPGGFGHPFWGIDDTPIEDHLAVYADVPLDWRGCLDRIGEILGRRLNADVSAWKLHVFPEVSGIPTRNETGSGTVVLIQVSHALMAGPAMTSLSEALFAPAGEPVRIEGLVPAAVRPRVNLAALVGLLRLPWQVCRFNAAVLKENRRIARAGDDSAASPWSRGDTMLNRRTGLDRAMRTAPLDLATVRRPGLTVTAVGLTAISRALERYLVKRGDQCPDDLAAAVTIAVPDAEVMGVNRVGNAFVDLWPGEPELAGRARKVDATLRVRRTSASSVRELNRIRIFGMLPSRVYRTRFGSHREGVHAHTTLTSIKCDPTAEWSLCGRAFHFAGMLQPVYPDIALVHSFVGVGDAFTVSVGCDPAIVADLDDYFDILLESFQDVSRQVVGK